MASVEFAQEKHRTGKISFLLFAVMMALLFEKTAHAELSLNQRYELSHYYSDNIEQAIESERREGQLSVYRAALELDYQSPKLENKAEIALRQLDYMEAERSDHSSKNMNMTGFYRPLTRAKVDWLASYQQVLQADETQLPDNPDLVRPEFLVDRARAMIMPAMGFRLGSLARSRYVYSKAWTRYIDTIRGDSDIDDHKVELANAKESDRTGWSGKYNQRDIHYLQGVDVIYKRVDGGMSYALTEVLRISGAAGWEHIQISSPLARLNKEGNILTLNLRWRLSPRLNVNFTAGKRYFGNTLDADVNYNKRSWGLAYVYRERLTDNQQMQFERTQATSGEQQRTPNVEDIADSTSSPVQAQQPVDSLTADDPAGLADVYLAKSHALSYQLRGSRFRVRARYELQSREYQLASLTENRKTATVTLVRNLSRRTSGTLAYSMASIADFNDVEQSRRVSQRVQFNYVRPGSYELQIYLSSRQHLAEIQASTTTNTVGMTVRATW